MPAHLRLPLVAGCAVAALLPVLILRSDGSASTAAEPLALAAAAEASPRTMSGLLVTRSRLGGRPATSRSSFLLAAAGDQLVVNSPRQPSGEDTAYLAATATEMRRIHPPAKTRAIISTGLGPAPPDLGSDDHVLRRRDAQIVIALAAAGDPRVQPTTHAGRRAWRLRAGVPISKLAGPGGSPDHLEIVADRETGLPLLARETLRGKLLLERRVERLRFDVPAPASAFTLKLPRTPRPLRFDYGHRNVPLGRAAAVVGYAPLVPAALPDGYRRSRTTIARSAGRSGNEGSNPLSRNVVTTAYRRGFELVVVATRCRRTRKPPCSKTGGFPRWSDPIGAGEGTVVDERPLALSEGALADSRARLVIDAQAVPHIWALTDNLVVTIAGPLSANQLIAAAGSLQPMR